MVGCIPGGTLIHRLHKWELFKPKENPALNKFLWICSKCGETTDQPMPLQDGCAE